MPTSDLSKRIIASLRSGEPEDLVIVFVPSHDNANKQLPSGAQTEWAITGLELLSELYGGGTAFETFRGVYRSEETGEDLWDNPILLECYTMRGPLEDPDRLRVLGDYLRRMKRELRQECVMVVVNDTRHFV